MSIKRMTAVWDSSTHKGADLLLLLAIADHADNNGMAWPGLETLAQRSRTTIRSVIRAIKRLEQNNELFVYRRDGKHNYYLVLTGFTDEQREAAFDVLCKRANVTRDILSPVTSTSPPRDVHVTPPVTSTSPDPSLTTKEPSDSGATAPRKTSNAKPKKQVVPKIQLNPMVDAFVEALGLDPDKITETRWSSIRGAARELCLAGYGPDIVARTMKLCRSRKYDGITEHALSKYACEVAAQAVPAELPPSLADQPDLAFDVYALYRDMAHEQQQAAVVSAA